MCPIAYLDCGSMRSHATRPDSSERQFKVGDRVKVSLPVGHIVDATIRAVIDHEDGVNLQVDYGHDSWFANPVVLPGN